MLNRRDMLQASAAIAAAMAVPSPSSLAAANSFAAELVRYGNDLCMVVSGTQTDLWVFQQHVLAATTGNARSAKPPKHEDKDKRSRTYYFDFADCLHDRDDVFFSEYDEYLQDEAGGLMPLFEKVLFHGANRNASIRSAMCLCGMFYALRHSGVTFVRTLPIRQYIYSFQDQKHVKPS